MRELSRVEAAIDRLINLLDAIDAVDEDREPQGDDEPSLGALEQHSPHYPGGADQTYWASGNNQDLEHEHDGREPEHFY